VFIGSTRINQWVQHASTSTYHHVVATQYCMPTKVKVKKLFTMDLP